MTVLLMRCVVTRLVVTFWTLTILIGCGAGKEFGDRGYRHPVHGYSINYVNPMLRAFIDHNWIIDNYEYDYARQKLVRKDDVGYHGFILYDRNSTGRPVPEKAYYSDLVLRHEPTEGIIWICTRELMPKQEEIKDEVFMGHYINSLVGKKRRLCGDVFGFQRTEKRFKPKVLSKESVDVGVKKGTAATIELGELEDRVYLRKGPFGRVRVVFTRIDSTIHVTKLECKDGKDRFPKPGKVLMIMGYFNSNEHFDDHLKDFDFFMEQIFYK
jgi:hypothetical protein